MANADIGAAFMLTTLAGASTGIGGVLTVFLFGELCRIHAHTRVHAHVCAGTSTHAYRCRYCLHVYMHVCKATDTWRTMASTIAGA